MHWLTLLSIAVGLAMDAFAVAAATGLALAAVTPRHVFRLAFHFGLFQFLMPVIGWVLGSSMAARLGDYDHWIAFALLWLVGLRMLREAFAHPSQRTPTDPTRGWSLITLSVATSLDALAVGLSLALLGAEIWTASVVIGLVAAALTALGLALGSRLGRRWGFWAEVAGAAVLLAIGARILLTHLVS